MLFTDLRYNMSMVCYSPIKDAFLLLNPRSHYYADGRLFYKCLVDGCPDDDFHGRHRFSIVLEETLMKEQYEFICTL